jgi:hypothetical protein
MVLLFTGFAFAHDRSLDGRFFLFAFLFPVQLVLFLIPWSAYRELRGVRQPHKGRYAAFILALNPAGSKGFRHAHNLICHGVGFALLRISGLRYRELWLDRTEKGCRLLMPKKTFLSRLPEEGAAGILMPGDYGLGCFFGGQLVSSE